MPTGSRKCKVCGKEYPYCKTVHNDNIFRYQDVACCPQHGSIYFAKIMKSRNGTVSANEDVTPDVVNTVNDFSDLIEDEEDALFEEDFEDDGDEDND